MKTMLTMAAVAVLYATSAFSAECNGTFLGFCNYYKAGEPVSKGPPFYPVDATPADAGAGVNGNDASRR